MSNCLFCRVSQRFNYTHFSDLGEGYKEQKCEAWIDYELKKNDKELLWYAILNGDQYTIGHTLVILGSHKKDIVDCLTPSELEDFAVGLNKVARKLKNILE